MTMISTIDPIPYKYNVRSRLPPCCQGCFFNKDFSGDQACHYLIYTGEKRPRTEDGVPSAEAINSCAAKLVLPKEEADALNKKFREGILGVKDDTDVAFYTSCYMRRYAKKGDKENENEEV